MNISIIGTGSIGGTIAQKLAQAGHQVEVANSKGIDGVRAFASSINATAQSIDTIGSNADVLILSIPIGAIADLPKTLWQRLPKTAVIVDTSNYYPEIKDAPIGEIDKGEVESVWVSKQIRRTIVKAFNTLIASSLQNLGKAKGEINRIAMQLAGDEEPHKKIVSQLINDCGFEPFDSGDLATSWQMQAGSAGYCCDYTADELREIKAKSAQSPKSVAQNRFETMTNFTELAGGDFSAENIIKINRLRNI